MGRGAKWIKEFRRPNRFISDAPVDAESTFYTPPSGPPLSVEPSPLQPPSISAFPPMGGGGGGTHMETHKKGISQSACV